MPVAQPAACPACGHPEKPSADVLRSAESQLADGSKAELESERASHAETRKALEEERAGHSAADSRWLAEVKAHQDSATRWGKRADAMRASEAALRGSVLKAIEYAGNRWSEWGSRAEGVREMLDAALTELTETRKALESELEGKAALVDDLASARSSEAALRERVDAVRYILIQYNDPRNDLLGSLHVLRMIERALTTGQEGERG